MGVECTAYTYIGLYVKDAEEYLVCKGLLKEGELEEEHYGDFECADLPLDVRPVSGYTNEGYYVGFEVHPAEYKKFDNLIHQFKEITGDTPVIETFEHWH